MRSVPPLLVFFLLLTFAFAGAAEVYYRTLSNLNCRPLGMGGAPGSDFATLALSGSYYSREYPVIHDGAFMEGGVERERKSGYGFTVGATWEFTPEAYVAATYVDLPDGLPDCRANLEGLGDETVNLGLARFPFPDVVLSMDVRNLVNSRAEAFREVRLGLDQRLLPHVTFRAGYAYTAEEEHLWSLGLGVGDGLLGAAGGIETNLAQSSYILDYTLVRNQTADEIYHLMSFIVTF